MNKSFHSFGGSPGSLNCCRTMDLATLPYSMRAKEHDARPLYWPFLVLQHTGAIKETSPNDCKHAFTFIMADVLNARICTLSAISRDDHGAHLQRVPGAMTSFNSASSICKHDDTEEIRDPPVTQNKNTAIEYGLFYNSTSSSVSWM